MDISPYIDDEGPDVFYDEKFRAVIEAHIDFLKTHKETKVIYLDPNIVYKYEFDMYGLMKYYSISPYLHWIILRMNDLYSMTNFPKDIAQLIVPSESAINHIRQIFMSAN